MACPEQEVLNTCPSCGRVDVLPLFVGYVRCQRCGGAWLTPLPQLSPEKLFDRTYFEGGERGGYLDYGAEWRDHVLNARDRMRRLPPHPGTLLDVGCAYGFVLDEARRLGWRAVGVEVSEFAASVARDRGHDVFGSITDAVHQLGRPPDVVTFFQVLEHLRHPADELAAAREAGMVVIETWNASSLMARLFRRHWQQVSPPSVIHLFTATSLRAMLASEGFRDVAIQRSSKRVSARVIAGVLASHQPTLFGPLRRAVEQSERLAALSVRYGAGDLITVCARR